MYIRFAIYFLLDVVANIVGYLINPLLPLFAGADGRLPNGLSWFQPFDATLDGTETRFIAATAGRRDEHGNAKSKLDRCILRVLWLYRNNAYGFSHSVLGAKMPLRVTSETSRPYPSDRFPAIEGSYFSTFIDAEGVKYFHYAFVKDRGNGKCYEAAIGWKTMNGMFVCRWTPFRTFNG